MKTPVNNSFTNRKNNDNNSSNKRTTPTYSSVPTVYLVIYERFIYMESILFTKPGNLCYTCLIKKETETERLIDLPKIY